MYIDDCIYFSEPAEVEQVFEDKLHKAIDGKISIMGNVSHFLGIKFSYHTRHDGNESIFLTQTAFIVSLANMLNINEDKTVQTPYRSDLPIDKLPPDHPPYHLEEINLIRRIVGSLLWLSQSTRPDIEAITNMLSSYQTIPSPAHIQAAKKVSFNTSKNDKINFDIDSSGSNNHTKKSNRVVSVTKMLAKQQKRHTVAMVVME